jgi:hypothetical protein
MIDGISAIRWHKLLNQQPFAGPNRRYTVSFSIALAGAFLGDAPR